MPSRWLLGAALLVGCGSSVSAEAEDAAVADTSSDVVMDTAMDDTASSEVAAETGAGLRRCSTTGAGAVAGDACFLLTPAECGLPAGGVNATVDQYALRPVSGARGKLMVFFNGSGGSPRAGTRGSPTDNFYATARAAGLHVLALSYRSDETVGGLCKGNDGCFLPTRRTILTGTYEPGAATALAGIAVHEGAIARLIAALNALTTADPSGGWGAFLDPAATKPLEKVRWPLVIAAGHSQGGGHAALMGRAFPLDRVVALSSPCDTSATGPATWLDPTKATFATAPATAFHGLGAPGDAVCPGYPAIWDLLGLGATRRHADAVICAGSAAHGATLECVENAAVWKKMLE